MTVPNILTISRLVLTVLFIWVMCAENAPAKVYALLIFCVAASTDFFDGFLARKYNLVSDFGKIMDPIADKFLVLSAFLVLVCHNLMPLWMFVVIAVREILITAIRLVAMKKGNVLAAESAGKLKTVIQTFTIFLALVYLSLLDTDGSFRNEISSGNDLGYAVYYSMWATVIITLYSGFQFLWNNRRKSHA